jgi:hypothetical protein
VGVARADAVDAELDRLVSRRASQDRRPDPDEQEELWKASVRRYNARPLYEEFKAAPSEGVLERRLADAETLFAAPEASHFATVPTF